MTWTYDPTLLSDPISGPLMQTRRYLGDVDTTDPLITDEELSFRLTSEGDPLHAAMQAALDLSAQFERLVDYTQPNDISEQASQRAKGFAALAAQIERRLARNAAPYAGGQTIADVEARREDTGIVQPYFQQGMDEEPGIWSDQFIDPNQTVPM